MATVDQRAHSVARLGLATRATLASAGISGRTLRRRLAERVWSEPIPGVIDVTRHPWTWHRRIVLALLAAPGGALLSHDTAATLHGLIERCRTPPHLLVARQLRHVHVPARLHTVVGTVGATVVDGYPVTDVRRTLGDLAVSASPRELHHALRIALGDGRVGVEEMLGPCGRDVPGSRRLREATLLELEHAGRPTESSVEREWVHALLGTDLPPFVTQHPVVVDDRRFRLDIAWPDHRVVVEVDGKRFHGDALTKSADGLREEALGTLDWLVTRVSTLDLRSPRFELVVGRLARQLGGTGH